MSISLHAELESRLRSRAEAEGISVEAYVERLLLAEQKAQDELLRLAQEGLNSGNVIEAGPGFWEERHRQLEARLKS